MPRRNSQITPDIVDTPTDMDWLGYEEFAAPIAERIANSNEDNTPLTIGVYGEWGSGKTSFLKMVGKKLIEGDPKIQPIWFNAWKYDKEDNLWAALIQSILEEIRINGYFLKRFWIRLQLWWRNLDFHSGAVSIFKQFLSPIIHIILVVVVISLFRGWGKTTVADWLAGIVPDLVNAKDAKTVTWVIKAFAVGLASIILVPEAAVALFDKQLRLDFDKFRKKHGYREHIAFLDEFAKEFQHIVNITSNGRPLVIIIDDLDRCMPEKAVQVLEAIKLFVDVKNCVFLLAVDREIVEKAILTKYKDLIEHIKQHSVSADTLSTFLGENYFEKIVQLPVTLPTLSPDDIENLIRHLCPDDKLLQSLSHLFSIGLPSNPRKIKRVLLIFYFLHQVAKQKIDDGQLEPSLLAKLVIIQVEHRVLYREILDNPSLLAELETYFDHQVNPDKVQSSDSREGLSPNVRKHVEKLAEQHAPVAKILLTRVDGKETDSFCNVDLKKYIYIVRSVVETLPEPQVQSHLRDIRPPGVPELIERKPENTDMLERKYLHRLQNQFELSSSIKTTQNANVKTQNLFIPPEFVVINGQNETGETLQIKDLFLKHSKLLVVGDPGIGKTVFVQQIAKAHTNMLMAEKTNRQGHFKRILEEYGFDKPLFPIVLRVGTFAINNEQTKRATAQTFQSYWWHELHQQLDVSNAVLDMLRDRLDRGQCIMFLDGFDEINEENRSYFLEAFRAFQLLYPSNYYVMTTRPFLDPWSLPHWSDTQNVRLLPLNTNQVLLCAKNLLGDDNETSAFLKSITNDKNWLADFVKNPSALKAFWQIYDAKGALPTPYRKLIDLYLEEIIRHREPSKGIQFPYSARQVYSILGKIVQYMDNNNHPEISQEVILSIAEVEQITEPKTFLRYLVERLSVIRETQPGNFTFTHKAYYDFFRKPPNGNQEIHQEA